MGTFSEEFVNWEVACGWMRISKSIVKESQEVGIWWDTALSKMPSAVLSLRGKGDEFSLGFTCGTLSTKCLHFSSCNIRRSQLFFFIYDFSESLGATPDMSGRHSSNGFAVVKSSWDGGLSTDPRANDPICEMTARASAGKSEPILLQLHGVLLN